MAEDPADRDIIWVTEVWDSQKNHDASLNMPSVTSAISRAKPLVSRFERIAVTAPVWGAEFTGNLA